MDVPHLNPAVIAAAAELAGQFARRDPFRHVVIDDFFAADFLSRLLDDFPAFERGDARNEAGELGGKSVVERIRNLGAAYAQLDELIQSPAFLGLISTITGIPDLLYDPHYFGGGTHENRAGQELDPHVDFNRHPLTGTHRRLNLIVYLNRQWQDSWGGSLELHSDPRSADNRISQVTPLLNRAVIFETTECSWHGFARIQPPRDDISRRSIALYFYTEQRPAEELAAAHSTIYVDRPLPPHLVAGHSLSDADVERLRELLARRDHHLARLYRDCHRLEAQLAQAQALLRARWLSRIKRALLGPYSRRNQ